MFENGNCEAFLNYGSVESKNDAARTGVDMGMGQPLNTPPNYYVSIYNFDNGQAAVRSSGKLYGSLDASADDEVKASTWVNEMAMMRSTALAAAAE